MWSGPTSAVELRRKVSLVRLSFLMGFLLFRTSFAQAAFALRPRWSLGQLGGGSKVRIHTTCQSTWLLSQPIECLQHGQSRPIVQRTRATATSKAPDFVGPFHMKWGCTPSKYVG